MRNDPLFSQQETLQVGTLVLLTHQDYYSFLTSWYKKRMQAPLIYSLNLLFFQKVLVPFSGKWHLEIKSWGWKEFLFIAMPLSSLLFLLVRYQKIHGDLSSEIFFDPLLADTSIWSSFNFFESKGLKTTALAKELVT